jgi:predicted transcriptional regulator
MAKDSKRYFLPEEVARILGVTPAAVRTAARLKKIKALKRGRIWLIPDSSVYTMVLDMTDKKRRRRDSSV